MIKEDITKPLRRTFLWMKVIVLLCLLQTVSYGSGFQPANEQEKDPDFIFVGAGPVGLWTGIQLKIRQPDADILFIERHEVYKRNHTLRINKSSYAGRVVDPELEKLVKELNGHVRNSYLENRLLGLAKEIGIRINYKKVTGVSELISEFPDTQFIIGSDGSHSMVRKSIVGETLGFQRDLKYIVDIKYEVKGQAMRASYLNEYPTTKIMNHLATEYVGRSMDGVTPVTLRLFVDRDTFMSLSGSTFANPYILGPDRNKIPKALDESIKIWMNMKAVIYGEKRVEGSEKVLPIRLQAYNSSSFVKSFPEENRSFALVGDAAFGVPFFRSLNNGLLFGSQLASALSRCMEKDRCEASLEKYSKFLVNLAKKEIAVAETKSTFLSSFGWLVSLSNIVPWQLNYWGKKKAELFKTRDPGYQNPI